MPDDPMPSILDKIKELIKRFRAGEITAKEMSEFVRSIQQGIEVVTLDPLMQALGASVRPIVSREMGEATRWIPPATLPGASALGGIATPATAITAGGLLLGGSTPRSPRGLEFAKQYATMYGEPDPTIFGGDIEPTRVAGVEKTLRRMGTVKPFIEIPTERIPPPVSRRAPDRLPFTPVTRRGPVPQRTQRTPSPSRLFRKGAR